MISLIFKLLLISAWSQNPTQPVQPVTPAPAVKTEDAKSPVLPETSPAVIKTEDYVYDPTGRRDPFQPYKSFSAQVTQVRPITTSTGKVKSEPLPETVDPLIRMDLDKMQVVGIIWEVANPRALVIDGGDKDKTVRILTKHTKVGRNNGYVAAIREGEIVIIESFEEEGIVNQQPRVFKLINDK